MIPNVLAERYASSALKDIWSPEGRILLERELWLAVARAQKDLGLDIPQDALDAYEAVKEKIDLSSIDARERVTRHDVKARIEEFNDLAGQEQLHKGMTSRDLTENVEQLQVYRSLLAIRDKVIAALARLSNLSTQYADQVITARTHNVAAQTTTLGKRLAMFGEELLGAYGRLEHLLETYAVRGLKGAVGTQLDQLSLFEGDSDKVAQLEERLATHLGLPSVWSNVGQVYPRSLDMVVVSLLLDISSSPSSFAKTLRLMAGHETASEGFAPGQTGSSAMPHKMNSRSCERINGFHSILKGHLTMASSLAGDQWNEGDVSCSVVRRVMLPDAFFATDGLFETLLTVLDQMDTFPAVINRENTHYLPFLLTTTIMMEAIKAGVGRETAHLAIKENALATVTDLRAGTLDENDLLHRLAEDERIPLDLETLQNIFEANKANTGNAAAQVNHFTAEVAKIIARHPQAATYSPGSIL
ncbi:MAG: adenylosuccinate lyase [Verrucomicrobiota bacterium JB023]|nr:adenylosuccinate lyase [Verrucomicrobiota bacterium JB023]